MPVLRFNDRYPFASTGCDYLGPLYVKPVFEKETDELFKAYIILYTCASTRAVVLEVASSLDTVNFLQSFRRFKARRGCPQLMISDNGSSFVADETQMYAVENFIEWQFNPACAPWWGGQWEILVSCVKRCLKKKKKKKINATVGTVFLAAIIIPSASPPSTDHQLQPSPTTPTPHLQRKNTQAETG